MSNKHGLFCHSATTTASSPNFCKGQHEQQHNNSSKKTKLKRQYYFSSTST